MSGILCDIKSHRQQLTLSLRVFSSLLGEGVACQWTASSSLTFVASNPASVIASGVFFDGWPYRPLCVFALKLTPGTAFTLTQEDVLTW